MFFTAYSLSQTKSFYPKTHTMSRQNRNTVRDRKSEDPKRDVANSNDRYPRQGREEFNNQQQRIPMGNMPELDRYRLNDLYERSSL